MPLNPRVVKVYKVVGQQLVEIGQSTNFSVMYENGDPASGMGLGANAGMVDLSQVTGFAFDGFQTPVQTPLHLGSNARLTPIPDVKKLDQLYNILGHVIDRLGGGIVMDAHEVMQEWNIIIQQMQDPFGIKVISERTK